ncbi:DUF4232 domain-containing protein [Cryobacterium sp. AP23]
MIRSRMGHPVRVRLRRAGGALLVLAGCSLALTACDTPMIPTLPPVVTPTAIPSAVPTPVPAPTGTPSPTPPSAPGTPPSTTGDTAAACSATDATFTVTDRPGDSGAGSFFWDLRLRNTADRPCLVDGYPGVVLINVDTGQPVGAASGREPRAAPAELRLEPGDSAYSLLHLTQAGAYGCPVVPVTSLAVTLPAGDTTAEVAAPHPIDGCDDPAVQLVRAGAFAAEPVVF